MDYREVIGEAIVFIENNLREPLNAVMVSKAVGYSYYHFHRHFLFAMGETVGSYIRGRRLTQAASELVHSDRNILDIAVGLRFESAESFSRAFKKKYRLTPSAYRKQGVDALISSHPPLDPADVGGLISLSPDIVEVPGMRVLGLTYEMSVAENESPAMWARLNDLLARAEGAPVVGDRYGFYESGADCSQTTFEEGTAVRAFIGTASPEGCTIEGFAEKRFSGGRYARFVHRGRVEDLPSTYRYLWGVWFPQSGYDLADRDDFERYGPRFLGPDETTSEIEVFFPIA
ncbi:GyrI-like domain-containing protein [Eggerthella timonensis]|uniref:GyrI-like domain-containing protein n=1 Tax=Eggerthella timonensis TaxID=1871008 RepID=UPI000C78694B|nr:GyrI-like domain-containing protein [Eggerthella timonensis]